LFEGDEFDGMLAGQGLEIVDCLCPRQVGRVLRVLPPEFLPADNQGHAKGLKLLKGRGSWELLRVRLGPEQRVFWRAGHDGSVHSFPTDDIIFEDWDAGPSPSVHLSEARITVSRRRRDLRHLRMRE